jgi:hypothetical protein
LSNKLEGLHQKPDKREETRREGQNFSEVVAPQEEEEEEEEKRRKRSRTTTTTTTTTKTTTCILRWHSGNFKFAVQLQIWLSKLHTLTTVRLYMQNSLVTAHSFVYICCY